MIPNQHILLITGLLCFPSIALGGAHQRVDDIVTCVNLQSEKNRELRISNTAGPVAHLLDRDDFDNLCTAEDYFCIVSAEVSWMFTWYVVMKFSEDGVSAYDLRPEMSPSDIVYVPAHHYINFPEHLVQAISKCDVQWEGHWVGESLFFEAQSNPSPKVLNEVTSPSWRIDLDDLLPPPEQKRIPPSE